MKSSLPRVVRALLAATLAGLAPGCAHHHLKTFYLPNGELAYIAKCPGKPDVSDCYNRAHATCHGPYYIFSQNDDPADREVVFTCPPEGAPEPQPMPPMVPR